MVNLISLSDTGNYGMAKARRAHIMKYYNISGVSSDNEYVPLFGPIVHRGIFNKQIVHYSLPKEDSYKFNISIKPITSYSKMYKVLEKDSQVRRFKTRSMTFTLLIIKGAIFEKIDDHNAELLFSVGVREDYMIQMFKDKPLLDKSKFVMLVSSKLSIAPRYKTIYSKLYKEVIIPNLETGIDIIITNNIADKCFKNKVKIPKFRNVTQIREYLHAFNLEI